MNSALFVARVNVLTDFFSFFLSTAVDPEVAVTVDRLFIIEIWMLHANLKTFCKAEALCIL